MINERPRRNEMKNTLYNILLIAILVFAGFGCSGGGGNSNPTQPNPSGQQGNPNLGTISGRIVDLEGHPIGGSNVDVQLFDEVMNPLSALFHPASSGPLVGEFTFSNLPLNTTIVLTAEHRDPTIGRLIGYDRNIRFTNPGHEDLGNCIMSSEQLTLGWSAYATKKYNLALYHFKRALNTRYADAVLTQSSSAYNGIGWLYVKRGRDLSGSGPANQGFQWQEGINNLKLASANPNDADAYVGMAGAYMTLVAQTVLLEPDQFDGKQFIYGYLNLYQDDALKALDGALKAAPEYDCAHDDIMADDLRACQLYNKYLVGETITQDMIDDLITSNDLNVGSLQLLTALSELIAFDADPKL
jgi:hypothetical protein